MKQALFLASGFAWLNLASAACCRSNKCLKAIVLNQHGVDDCASALVETVSAPARIVTETVTVSSTQYATVLGTEIVTEIESTTAATETVFFTESSSVTVGTETVTQLTTETTIASTETVFQTITVPAPTEEKRDIDTLTFVEPTSSASVEPAPVQSSPALPEYALDCPSFDTYKSACKCVGAEIVTVTVPVPVSTVTVEETTTVSASVAATVTTTETELVSVTATASATATVLVDDVDTVTATQTDVVSLTATVTAIETATLAPEPVQPVCQINTGAFRAMTTFNNNNNNVYMYANMLNALTGGLNWQAGSTSTSQSMQPRYNFALDSEGSLYLHDRIAPYTYTYYVYISTVNSGSNWPQINTKQAVESSIAAGGRISKIKGCVNPVTGELTLQDSIGRKNILYCGAQVWLSAGLGEDVNRGGCSQQFPHVVPPYGQ